MLTSPESTPTPSQNQIEFQQFFESMSEQIAVANLRLEEVRARAPEDYRAVEIDVIESLDEIWPYHGHQFLVVGQWSIGRQKLHPKKSSIKFWTEKEDVLQPAFSEGFNVDLYNDTPKVHLSFVTSPIAISLNNTRLQGLVTANALPEEVSLDYIGDLPTSEDLLNHPMQLIDKIELSESLHKLYLNKSNFFQLPHSKQQKLIDGLVTDINEQIINSQIQIELNTKTTKAYIHNPSAKHGLERVMPPDGKRSLRVHGSLAGVAIFNSPIYDEGQVTSVDELIDAQAGLSYEIVDLLDDTTKAVRKHLVARVACNDAIRVQISSSI